MQSKETKIRVGEPLSLLSSKLGSSCNEGGGERDGMALGKEDFRTAISRVSLPQTSSVVWW